LETPTAQIHPEPPLAFPFKTWLAWFFLLLLPPGVILTLLVINNSSLPEEMQYKSGDFFSWTFVLLPFIIGNIQWFYLRTQLPRSYFWVIIQTFVYSLVAFNISIWYVAGFVTLTRNFSNFERLISFGFIMVVFLLPGALLHFVYFRVKHLPVGWSWFRDYAVVLGVGLLGFWLYDDFTFERPPLIPGVHGQHYFDLAIFFIFISAAVAWVMARVPYPGVVKLARAERPPEKYLQHGVFKRLLYWLAWLFPSGFFMFVACTGYLEGPFEGLIFGLLVAFNIFFFLAEWKCFDRLAQVPKKVFIFSALIFPIVFFVGWVPALQNKPAHVAILILASLAVGLIQHAGLRGVLRKVSRYFFLYFCIAFSICLLIVLMVAGNDRISGSFPWYVALAFPILISLLLAMFIHPGVFQGNSNPNPSNESEPSL
jgi:hypothetical protein